MDWTLIQPTYFMQSLLWQADSIANGVYLDDLGGPVSWGDARDIADVSAVALTSDGHERKTYGLTDEHALNGERIGAQLNEVTTRNHPPKGYLAGLETTVQDILNRPARTFANFITDNCTSFSRRLVLKLSNLISVGREYGYCTPCSSDKRERRGHCYGQMTYYRSSTQPLGDCYAAFSTRASCDFW